MVKNGTDGFGRPGEASTTGGGEKYDRRYWDVIDAAASVFAEKGYHGASTRDIAERAGLRQGSLYYYIPSKQRALEAVCRRGIEDIVGRLVEIAESSRSSTEKIVAAIENHLAPIRIRPQYARVFFKNRHALSAPSRHEVGALTSRYEKVLAGILREGAASGAFRRDLNCRLAMLALLGMCNAAADWLPQDDGEALAETVRAFSTLFRFGIETKSKESG